MITQLKKYNLLLLDNKYNQKITFKNLDKFPDAKEFLNTIFKKFPKLLEAFHAQKSLSNLIHALKYYKPTDNLNDLLCKCPSCNNLRYYDSSRKTLIFSCVEHKKDPEVIKARKAKKLKTLRENNLKKYGVINVAQLQTTKEKIKESNLKKYGVDNPAKLESTIDKRKITNLLKYGVSNPNKLNSFKEKIKDINIKKYGYSHFMKNPELRKKFHNKLLISKGYISLNPNEANIRNKKNLTKEFIQKNFIDVNQHFLLKEFMQYYNYSDQTEPYKFLQKFDIKYKYLKGSSRYETEIVNFLERILPENTKILTNTRSTIAPKELDIYLPEYNFGIEFNGLYWHSIGIEDINNSQKLLENKNKHLYKVLACEEKNINLFHIYEDDFNNKKEIIFSMLKNRLKSNTSKFFARKCTIREIDPKESREFINSNHIQGNSPSSVKLGLYYNDLLVSVMTFGKSRFNKKYDYELIRFCNLINSTIIGAASKLLKYFIKNYKPNNIVSYSNRNFSKIDNNIYHILGFELINTSKPDIKYIKNNKIFYRQQLTKSKVKKLINYDDTKSTDQNLLQNGYRILYGSGTGTFVWRKDA